MSGLVQNKVAVITGSSSGIGAVTAKIFAKEGAKVVLFARRREALEKVAEEIRSEGGECLITVGDVTVPSDCEKCIKVAVDKYGRVDVLINNAGAGDYHTTTTHASYEFWTRMIDLNQNSVFLFSKAALNVMEQQGSGNIINVSAIAGVYGNAGISYSAAKSAVIGMTKNIAIQYAGRGIRCNCICPGPTVVDRMDGREAPLMDKEFVEITKRHTDGTIPFSEPEEQANVMLFMASDMSSCMTGQIIVTDKGRCL